MKQDVPLVYPGLDHDVPEHGAGELQGGDGLVVQEAEDLLKQRGLHDQQQQRAGLRRDA